MWVWPQLLFILPERWLCERGHLVENSWLSDSLITPQIPLLCFTASASKTSNAPSHRNTRASSWYLLLMSYRFSLLPWCFTMHLVYCHQIFSTLWLELMHLSPWAEFKLLISERKLGFNKKNKKKKPTIYQSGKPDTPSFDLLLTNLED